MERLPHWFLMDWRRCALELSSAGVHHEFRPRRVNVRARDCWRLILLLQGAVRLEGVERSAPAAWLVPPDRSLTEDLAPLHGTWERAEVAFLVHATAGVENPLSRLAHPVAPAISDSDASRRALDGILAACAAWQPLDAQAVLLARPALDALLALHVADRAAADACEPLRDVHVPAWLDALLAWMAGQVRDRDLNVEALARHARYSPSHLSHAFREHLGTTPMAMLRRLRLRMAARLLRDTDLASVADVARRCGYANATMLARHFHEEYGCTPLDWRRRS